MPTSPHFNKILYKILLSFNTHVLINKLSDVCHFLRSTFARFSRILQNDNKQLSDNSLLCSQISQSTTETLFLGNNKDQRLITTLYLFTLLKSTEYR